MLNIKSNANQLSYTVTLLYIPKLTLFFLYGQLLQSGAPLLGLAKSIYYSFTRRGSRENPDRFTDN